MSEKFIGKNRDQHQSDDHSNVETARNRTGSPQKSNTASELLCDKIYMDDYLCADGDYELCYGNRRNDHDDVFMEHLGQELKDGSLTSNAPNDAVNQESVLASNQTGCEKPVGKSLKLQVYYCLMNGQIGRDQETFDDISPVLSVHGDHDSDSIGSNSFAFNHSSLTVISMLDDEDQKTQEKSLDYNPTGISSRSSISDRFVSLYDDNSGECEIPGFDHGSISASQSFSSFNEFLNDLSLRRNNRKPQDQ